MKANKKCKDLRTALYKISARILHAHWAQYHIANCSRCRQRLASAGRVHLALSLIKAQPHKLDLLMRANTQTISTLKHGLRYAPKAQKLKSAFPKQKLLERCIIYKRPLANVAACIVILFLMKIGIFSSVEKFHSEGQKVLKQYYVKNVGQDLANEIFPT
ncbi:MAG: hypothetical protein ACYS0I_11800 [Planctomycetota bacterium]